MQQSNFSVIHRIVMGADYNVPDKSESQRIIGFVSRIVAVIVNLVVIPSNQQKIQYIIFFICITLCPAGSDKIVIEKSVTSKYGVCFGRNLK
jgi:hypothetical protein